jgi:hypothetical protein
MSTSVYSARRPGERVLVLLDAADDCPATLGPALLAWAQLPRVGRPRPRTICSD